VAASPHTGQSPPWRTGTPPRCAGSASPHAVFVDRRYSRRHEIAFDGWCVERHADTPGATMARSAAGRIGICGFVLRLGVAIAGDRAPDREREGAGARLNRRPDVAPLVPHTGGGVGPETARRCAHIA